MSRLTNANKGDIYATGYHTAVNMRVHTRLRTLANYRTALFVNCGVKSAVTGQIGRAHV